MQLGLSSYTFGWAVGVSGHMPDHPMDEQALLDRTRLYGLKVIQICDNMPFLRLGAERLDRFAQRAAADGIRVEIGSRGLTPEHVAECVTVARRVGARLIRMVIDGPDHRPKISQTVQLLRAAVPLLGDLTLGIENHDRFPATTLRYLIESVGSDRVGICLDTANSLGAGEGLDTVVPILAPFTVNLHVKDFRVRRLAYQMGFTIEGTPAGQGFANIPWLLDQLLPFKRCASAVLELWTPPEPELAETIAKEDAWAGQSLDYLRPIFALKQMR